MANAINRAICNRTDIDVLKKYGMKENQRHHIMPTAAFNFVHQLSNSKWKSLKTTLRRENTSLWALGNVP